jgi:5-methylcytosine-specific restriction endonuclease McrA
MKSSKHRLCKVCLTSFPKESGKIYCSEICAIESKSIKKKCNPRCKDEDKIIVEATFKNGTKHYKKICGLCRRGYGFVSPRIVNKTCPVATKEKKIEQQVESRKKLYKDSFYTSRAWLSIRYDVLINSRQECVLCGSKQKPFHVDHIKPRSKHPELELDIKNLQVLCSSCNIGKWNKEAIP